VTENPTDDPRPPAKSQARAKSPALAELATPTTKRAARAPQPARAARPKGGAAKSKSGKSSGATKSGATASGPESNGAREPANRHPSLGLAPLDMTAGYAAAAVRLRSIAADISAGALEAATKADPTIRTRYDEVGLRRLLRDGELLVERLAMCLAGGEDRRLTEYAESIGPIYRRRGVPLNDLRVLCAGIRETVETYLAGDELIAAGRSLDAAGAVFARNGRLGGDRHKRNALLKWMYRGV